MITNNELMSRIFGMSVSNPNNRYKKFFIEDIPLMISGSHLICIPKSEEVKPFGCTGMTGTCKSIFINAQLSFRYWLCSRKCINVNDFQKETFEWSFNCDDDNFKRVYKQIGLNSCPLPLVYVFPSTKTVQIIENDKKYPILKMTLPIRDVIENVENFHSLDRSKLYLGNIKDGLMDCSSMQEIMEVLNETFPDKDEGGKTGMRPMRFKMLNVFDDLFKNKILNVSAPEAPSYLEFNDGDKTYFNRTIQTLMRANLIPSIQTSDLSNHDFFSAYMAFIIDSIYDNQYNDPYFKTQTINLFVDEIDKLWLGHNGNIIKRSLGLIGTNGRMARIELGWATQHYGKVPVQIRNNTKYLIVSRKSNAEEVKEIRKDFSIPKALSEEILNLRTEPKKGIFEAVCLTTERFVVYNLTNGDRFYSSEPRKGLIIPSPAKHRSPK